MAARENRKMNGTTRSRLALIGGAVVVAMFAFVLEADAKCSIRVADPLIAARYQECNPKAFISYLYNDLVTPFSFTCAKKLSETCQKENCSDARTEDEVSRCLGRYVEVLDGCKKQIDDAAMMARCKDSNTWPVEVVASRAPATQPGHPARHPNPAPGHPVLTPDPSYENPVTVEPLPALDAINAVKKASQPSVSTR